MRVALEGVGEGQPSNLMLILYCEGQQAGLVLTGGRALAFMSP